MNYVITEQERVIRQSQGYDIGFEQNGKKYWINSSSWNEEKNERFFQETGLKAFKEGTANKNLVIYNPEYFEVWESEQGELLLSYTGDLEQKIPQPINMSSADSMFRCCSGLRTLDLNDWDMSNVIDVGGMFSGCINLTQLHISDWDVQKITRAFNLFAGCESLKTLYISKWRVEKLINVGYMFDNCQKLEDLKLPDFKVKLKSSLDTMFSGCEKLYEKYSTQNSVEIYKKIREEANTQTDLEQLNIF